MNKILLLSGPDKKRGYEPKIKDLLKEELCGEKSIVFIAANPDNYEKNDKQVYGNESSLGTIKMLEQCNIKIIDKYIIDNRTITKINKEKIYEADIIYFMGGDPILQNEFVIKNKLMDVISKTNAFIIGVSAGSMNLAKKVFVPKYDLNPTAKFIDGFRMCDISIVPHFDINNHEQMVEIKENSKIHELIGLPNDSAVYININETKFINEYYLYNKNSD